MKILPVCCALICFMIGITDGHVFLGAGPALAGPVLADSDLIPSDVIPSDSASSNLAARGLKSAVVVSRKIRPYLQVVDGIAKEADTGASSVDVFFLTTDGEANREILQTIADAGFDLVMAVGPEAASQVFNAPGLKAAKRYTAILDPLTIPGIGPDACGISLRIPVAEQLAQISRTLPSLKKLGLLFDPAYNQWFFDAAQQASQTVGIDMVPLAITRRSQIATALGQQAVDAVWMIPDQTVISEKIVQFAIKEGIYRNIGVIGYNAFFIKSGAVFSFEFDYQELGRQAGRKILKFATQSPCLDEPPVFNTLVNRKMAERIGMEVAP